MITGQLRSDIDKLWTEFWSGGITNPLTVIEQISFLMFARLLDIAESRNEKLAARLLQSREQLLLPVATPGRQLELADRNRRLFKSDQQYLRWSRFKNVGGEEMLRVVRDEVFPHFRGVGSKGSTFGEYMKDAQLMIVKPSLLVSAVSMIDRLPLTVGDTKGDLYEYLLSKLTTAGINGQFRTPRHVIRLMVEMVDPKPNEIVGDPACGTAGFPVGVMLYLLENYTSPEGVITHEDGGKTYTGDLLEPYREHIQTRMFHGFDFDVTMLRIAAMNLMLHGVETPDIHYQDTLSKSFTDRFREQASDFFDVILANPPFKGSLDAEDVHTSLTAKVKTKKTELLFLTLMLRMLKLGGRCASIVPDGVLFGTSKAHTTLRQMLVDQNQLEAVISLPAGVFKPYAGVSTAIVVFTKGGKTEHVFFYDVQADGFSLDDKRDPIDENDLPDALQRWNRRDPAKDTDRKAKAFFVPAQEIRDNKYDLSLNRYKEVVYEEVAYDRPKEIVGRLRELESQIGAELASLEDLL
jgi:type I restriction enzyme M protein